MTEKNIVILRIETGNPSGVVRYIQMLTEGMRHINGIKVHIICLNTSLIFLMVGFFNGIAVGAGVVISKYFGAADYEGLKKAPLAPQPKQKK